MSIFITQKNFVDTSASSQMFNVTDRATLNGILERTNAYATGSGFLDSDSVNGITVIPLNDNLNNRMVYVKREEVRLEPSRDFICSGYARIF